MSRAYFDRTAALKEIQVSSGNLWTLALRRQRSEVRIPSGAPVHDFAQYRLADAVGFGTGLLYEQSHLALVLFSVSVAIASLPVFVIAQRQNQWA